MTMTKDEITALITGWKPRMKSRTREIALLVQRDWTGDELKIAIEVLDAAQMALLDVAVMEGRRTDTPEANRLCQWYGKACMRADRMRADRMGVTTEAAMPAGRALSSLLELLDTLWPASQNPHGFRADQIAGRMIDHGQGIDGQAQALRNSLDAIGPYPLNAVTGFAVGHRLRRATDNPVVAEDAILVLRKCANSSRKHLPASYRIEREPRP
jgi:hypothetical protein